MPYLLICAILIVWATLFPYHWAGLPNDETVQYSKGDYAFLMAAAAIGPVTWFLWVINL